MKTLALTLSLTILTGCIFQTQAEPWHPPKPSTHQVEEKVQPTSKAEQKDPAARKVFIDRAIAATALEGHPKGRALLEAVFNCNDRYEHECGFVVDEAEKDAPAAYKAGMALREKNRDDAEKTMAEAEKLAADKDKARRALAEKLKAEDEALLADLKACVKDRTPCVERCKQDKLSSACVALASYLVTSDTKDDRFDRAEDLLGPPCLAGMKAACDAQAKASVERAEKIGPADAAWSTLVAQGDDLATKNFLHAFAASHFKGAKNARATERMGEHIQELTKSYCGTVKEYLKVSNRAELARRAKKHCSEDPPTATGLAGEEQVLTTECHAVYATSCP